MWCSRSAEPGLICAAVTLSGTAGVPPSRQKCSSSFPSPTWYDILRRCTFMNNKVHQVRSKGLRCCYEYLVRTLNFRSYLAAEPFLTPKSTRISHYSPDPLSYPAGPLHFTRTSSIHTMLLPCQIGACYSWQSSIFMKSSNDSKILMTSIINRNQTILLDYWNETLSSLPIRIRIFRIDSTQ